MRNSKYDFSSCHIDVPAPLSDDIVEWGRSNVHDNDIYVTNSEPYFGREDEIHITILYGIHSERGDKVRSVLENSGTVKVKLGKIDVFTNPYKFDVVVINVESKELKELNLSLFDNINFTNKYPVYKPHITISYVKKGKGWKHKGNSIWDGKEFVCNYAVFSSKNGTKERIIL